MAKSTMIVLLNISSWLNPKKEGQGTSLDVVHEVQDGKSYGVGVEKVYYLEGGAKRIPKKMDKFDFKRCAERWGEIKPLLDSKPPVPEVKPQQIDTLDEVPY